MELMDTYPDDLWNASGTACSVQRLGSFQRNRPLIAAQLPLLQEFRHTRRSQGIDSPSRYFCTSTRMPAKQQPKSSPNSTPQPKDKMHHASLPHLTSQSTAHMVSISFKPVTRRTATVIGQVRFSNGDVLPAIRSHLNQKGDVLGTSRIAGIMGAKRCADIIPLCHPGLGIEHASVNIEAVDAKPLAEPAQQEPSPPLLKPLGSYGGIRIEATVVCEGKTGIEMEAFTAVMAAAVTVVDMCKAVDKGLVIEGVRLVKKEGGRSGTYEADIDES